MAATYDLNDESVVVIIGSGAGGGTLSRQLSINGVKVVCLEAGPRLTLGDIVNDETEMFLKLSWLDRRIGNGDAPDGMPVWSCKTVGGTTAHWTANCPRFREYEFNADSHYGDMDDTNFVDWPFGLDEMAPYYDVAENMLGVTGTNNIPLLPPSNNFKVMEAGAKKIGYTDIDTYHMAINSRPRDGRPACLQMGFCSSGCAINAKWTTLFNHIPQAEQTDFFDLRAESMVTKILMDDEGKATGVRYIDNNGVVNGWGKNYADLMENYNKLAGVILTGEDPPQVENRITLHPTETDQYGLPVAVVTYNYHPNSIAMMDYAEDKARQMYESLGATDFFTIRNFGATHNLGTARIGNDPATSVCNSWGQTHDIDNLFISDGSLFPTSGSANPTLTIISLMLRQADYLIESLENGSI